MPQPTEWQELWASVAMGLELFTGSGGLLLGNT